MLYMFFRIRARDYFSYKRMQKTSPQQYCCGLECKYGHNRKLKYNQLLNKNINCFELML